VNISWAVTNAGNGITGNGRPAGIVSAWSDRVVLSRNGIYGDGDVVLLADVPHSGALTPGAQYTASFSGILPAGLSGAYQVFVFCDIADQVYEYTNAAPNLAAAATTLNAVPGAYADLEVANLSLVPPTLVSGGQVTVRWDTINSGNSATSGSWYDRVTIRNTTTSLTLLDTVTYYDANVLGPITNGQSRERQYAFRLPDGTNGVGDLTFTVIADTYNQLAEFNFSGTAESNNTASLSRTSTLAAYPDLAVHRFDVSPASFESGRQLTANWPRLRRYPLTAPSALPADRAFGATR
jgi:hypothetical protein